MKTVSTLTKTIALGTLLLIFAGASASTTNSDGDKDTTKCKKHSCKNKEAAKEVDQAVKEFNEAMKELIVQLKNLDVAKFQVELTQPAAPVRLVRTTNGFIFSYAAEIDNSQEEARQKIDFNNLDKEMNKVQEDMMQMDPALKKDDAKSRKQAEEILKTGIKS